MEDGRGRGSLDVRGSVDWGVCAAHACDLVVWFVVVDEWCVDSVGVEELCCVSNRRNLFTGTRN